MGPSLTRIFERGRSIEGDGGDGEGCGSNRLSHLCSAYDSGGSAVAQENQRYQQTAAVIERITQRSVEGKEPWRTSTDDNLELTTTNRIPRIVHQSSKHNMTTILVRKGQVSRRNIKSHLGEYEYGIKVFHCLSRR